MNTFPSKLITWAVVIGVGVFIYRALHPATTFAADGIDGEWDQAVEQAKTSGKPVLLLFTADWCPACRAMHASFNQSDIAAALDQYYCFKVDLTHPSEAARNHARKYRADYIPLLIRFDRDGHEVARTNGLPPDQLCAWLKPAE